jgi:hypothetical protein
MDEHRRMNWKFAAASVAGTSHHASGKPCEDCCGVEIAETSIGPLLIAVCADGAGSASRSELGSRLACEVIAREARAFAQSLELNGDPPGRAVVKEWYVLARAEILYLASMLQVTPRELACTLLTVVVGPDWAIFAQIGDGAIVHATETNSTIVFWPEHGEYANTTAFLTDANWIEHFRLHAIDEPIDNLALMTDGLERLALDFTTRSPHTPFFQPLFRAVAEAIDETTLSSALCEFLASPRVNARTDDDKTLILATRATL